MLGKFSRQEKSNSSLNLPGSDGGPLVVVGQPAGFGSNPLENVVNERVHDRHGLRADASIRVHLLQNLVDVDSVRFLSFSLPLASFFATSSFWWPSTSFNGFASRNRNRSGGVLRSHDELSTVIVSG